MLYASLDHIIAIMVKSPDNSFHSIITSVTHPTITFFSNNLLILELE